MGIEEMIEAEAQAQAICMMTKDFRRAFAAFAAKNKPAFHGDYVIVLQDGTELPLSRGCRDKLGESLGHTL